MGSPTENDLKTFASIKSSDKVEILWRYLYDGDTMEEIGRTVFVKSDQAGRTVSVVTRCYGLGGRNPRLFNYWGIYEYITRKDIEEFVKKYPQGCKYGDGSGAEMRKYLTSLVEKKKQDQIDKQREEEYYTRKRKEREIKEAQTRAEAEARRQEEELRRIEAERRRQEENAMWNKALKQELDEGRRRQQESLQRVIEDQRREQIRRQEEERKRREEEQRKRIAWENEQKSIKKNVYSQFDQCLNAYQFCSQTIEDKIGFVNTITELFTIPFYDINPQTNKWVETHLSFGDDLSYSYRNIYADVSEYYYKSGDKKSWKHYRDQVCPPKRDDLMKKHASEELSKVNDYHEEYSVCPTLRCLITDALEYAEISDIKRLEWTIDTVRKLGFNEGILLNILQKQIDVRKKEITEEYNECILRLKVETDFSSDEKVIEEEIGRCYNITKRNWLQRSEDGRWKSYHKLRPIEYFNACSTIAVFALYQNDADKMLRYCSEVFDLNLEDNGQYLEWQKYSVIRDKISEQCKKYPDMISPALRCLHCMEEYLMDQMPDIRIMNMDCFKIIEEYAKILHENKCIYDLKYDSFVESMDGIKQTVDEYFGDYAEWSRNVDIYSVDHNVLKQKTIDGRKLLASVWLERDAQTGAWVKYHYTPPVIYAYACMLLAEYAYYDMNKEEAADWCDEAEIVNRKIIATDPEADKRYSIWKCRIFMDLDKDSKVEEEARYLLDHYRCSTGMAMIGKAYHKRSEEAYKSGDSENGDCYLFEADRYFDHVQDDAGTEMLLEKEKVKKDVRKHHLYGYDNPVSNLVNKIKNRFSDD